MFKIIDRIKENMIGKDVRAYNMFNYKYIIRHYFNIYMTIDININIYTIDTGRS